MQTEFLYKEAVQTLTSKEKFHISLGIDRVCQILDLLGNPQDCLNVIHVAGTNGKGSTCAMLESVLRAEGYKTGLYTSPHLINYTERVKINGKEISENDFARLINQINDLLKIHQIPATEFEILTVMAFVFFKEQKTDVVILETGLGGRLDATNVVKNPLLSIITSIDIDHVDRLGNTIEQIAFEKSGIIKQNKPIVTFKNNKGKDVIKKTAQNNNSDLYFADSSKYRTDKSLIYTEKDSYELPLLGLWQLENLSLVLKSIEVLNRNKFNVSEQSVKAGLKDVCWQGRMQYLKEKNILLDGAHNISGAKFLRESLDFYFPDKKRIWIYSSLCTKDYDSIVKVLFNPDDTVILTKSCSNSAVNPEELKNIITKNNLCNKIYTINNLEESINLSLSLLSENFIIIIAGSLYTVGEALDFLQNIK